MSQIYNFSELKEAPLYIDAIYKGGDKTNFSSEPLHKLLPGMMNQKGFRPCMRKDGSGMPAYVVIFTTMDELEWPDHLFVEEGIFRYYGDNRKSGKDLHSTPGNKLLNKIFQFVSEGDYASVPPFLIFKKHQSRDVQFLGIAVPGNQNNNNRNEDLVSVWKRNGNIRFQNYLTYFTIIDTKNENISKEWLANLIYNNSQAKENAPKFWKKYVETGIVDVLKAEKITLIRSKSEQLPQKDEGKRIIESIYNFYKDNPQGFEKCATKIIELMDSNFHDIDVTRPWRDGGRDAVGFYKIGSKDSGLDVEFALEAKCYNFNNSVGVKQTSRLISRIKFRQFGVLVTTSFLDSQAYKEIKEDGHPIIVVSASDIYNVLRDKSIDLTNINSWLKNI